MQVKKVFSLDESRMELTLGLDEKLCPKVISLIQENLKLKPLASTNVNINAKIRSSIARLGFTVPILVNCILEDDSFQIRGVSEGEKERLLIQAYNFGETGETLQASTPFIKPNKRLEEKDLITMQMSLGRFIAASSKSKKFGEPILGKNALSLLRSIIERCLVGEFALNAQELCWQRTILPIQKELLYYRIAYMNSKDIEYSTETLLEVLNQGVYVYGFLDTPSTDKRNRLVVFSKYS